MTTDEVVRELLHEVKAMRRELSGVRVALTELGKDFRDFRERELAEARKVPLRLVATVPPDTSGGG